MKELNLRRVRLADYLIELGMGSDPAAQVRLFSEIYAGKIGALYMAERTALSADVSTASVLRRAFRKEDTPRQVPALSHTRVAAEIKKAALGRDADYDLLDRLVLLRPDQAESATLEPRSPSSTMAATATKLKPPSVFEEREKSILEVISTIAGIDQMAITPPTRRGGRDGDRNKIFRAMPATSMGAKVVSAAAFSKAFENTWDRMLKRGTIRLRATSQRTPR